MLQGFSSHNFPLQKYIINVERTIDPPSYIAPGTLYDLSELTCPLIALPALPQIEWDSKCNDGTSRAEEMSCQVNKLINNLPRPMYDASVAEQCGSVDVLSNEWPERNLFGLDESQFAALKAAITKQLTIIQGPPGISLIC